MVKVIPGRIENGYVVAESPLPAPSEVRSVRIFLEMPDPPLPAGTESTFALLHGLLKGYGGDPREDYRRYLETKYS